MVEKSKKTPSSIIIVTDSKVSKLYAPLLRDALSGVAKTSNVEFPAGEQNKNLESASFVALRLNELGADKDCVLLALGGGVVGDLVGFVASIYKRGIKYFQVPTTLLAQVDSSIGGKTGVDTNWGKNQLGTFYQPKAVFIDPQTLETLPSTELINGIAEMVKSAIVADSQMFDELSKIDLFSLQKIRPFIEKTCKIKAKVVSVDEKEENLRAILNYGHTVGHAVEASTGYRLSHGRSVVIGMIAEGWIACKIGDFPKEDYDRQLDLLEKLLSSAYQDVVRIDSKNILQFALADKKSSHSTIRMSLPERIGRMHKGKDESYKIPVSRELFEKSIQYVSGFLKQKDISQ